jgi:hypothetical protein
VQRGDILGRVKEQTRRQQSGGQLNTKRSSRYLLTLLLYSLPLACGSVAAASIQAGADGSTLSGHYIYGHEANSFQPCGGEKVYWVSGSDKMLELMAKKYSKLTTEPHEEVFAQIVGQQLGKATDGFAMDYDGQIQVIELIFMKKKSDTDCQ